MVGAVKESMTKNTLSILLILLFPAPLMAQQTDTLRLPNRIQALFQKSDGITNSVSSDTLSRKAKKKLERITTKKQRTQQKLNSLNPNNKVAGLNNKVTNRLDKLSPQNKLDKVSSRIKHFADSLSPEKRIARYQDKVDSLQAKMTSKIGDLQNLQLPNIRLTKSLDSLKGKLDSLKSSGLAKDMSKAEQKLTGLQSMANENVTSLQTKVNGRLDVFNKEGGNLGNVNLPTLPSFNSRLPNVGSGNNVPQLNGKLPSFAGSPKLNTNIGNVGNPLRGSITPGLPNAPSGGGGLNTSGLKLPSTSIGLKDIGLKDISKETAALNDINKDASKYQSQLKGLTKDGLIDEKLKKEVEADAKKMIVSKELEGKMGELEKQKALMEKWNRDPEYRKEMAVNQAKEQAVNHFAGKEKELTAAMDQLTNAKSKITEAGQVADMFKKPGNPMSGKTFIERLRPGFNLQIQSRQYLMIDLNPQIGYRISGRFTTGIGWNERFSYNSKKNSINFDDRVFGPRSYVQVKIKGSSYGLLNVECMNAGFVSPIGEGSRQWVWSYMAGYKQEFRISNKLLGNVQMMYSFYSTYYQSPYVDKLNIRTGFEFPQKKSRLREH